MKKAHLYKSLVSLTLGGALLLGCSAWAAETKEEKTWAAGQDLEGFVDESGLVGFRDKSGIVVIQPRYAYQTDKNGDMLGNVFDEDGVATVYNSGFWAVNYPPFEIDTKGQRVFDAEAALKAMEGYVEEEAAEESTEAEPDQEPDANQKPNADKKPDANQKPNADKKPDANQKPNADKKPDANQKPNADKKPDANQKSDADKKPEPDKKTDTEDKPETEKKQPWEPQFDVAWVATEDVLACLGRDQLVTQLHPEQPEEGSTGELTGAYGLLGTDGTLLQPVTCPGPKGDSFIVAQAGDILTDYLGRHYTQAELEAAQPRPEGNSHMTPWQDRETKLWGYRDDKGRTVVQPVLDVANSFVDGIAIIYYKGMPGILKNPLMKDYLSPWAEGGVARAEAAGLVTESCMEYGNFTITRQQFAQLSALLLERILREEIEPAPEDTFSDTDDMGVRKAAAAGIVDGVGDGLFAPSKPLTREQMATMLWRLLEQVGTFSPYTNLEDFPDSDQISDWALGGVTALVGLQVLRGDQYGLLLPKDSCTIEQSITQMLRASEL